MEDLFAIIIGGIIVVLPFVLILLDAIFLIKKKKFWIFEVIAFFIGSVYIALAYMLWDLPDYRQPLNIYGTANVHGPFNAEYIVALLLFAVWGFKGLTCGF